MKKLTALVLLAIVSAILSFTFVSCSPKPDLNDISVNKSDIEAFHSLYTLIINGKASNDDINKLDLLLNKFLSARYFSSDIDRNVVNAIKMYQTKHPYINATSIKSFDFDSREYYDLLALFASLSGNPTPDVANVSTQDVALFKVLGRVTPSINGGVVVANYSTSTSCVWWDLQHRDVIKPDSSGNFLHSRLFRAWWWCQPQVKNYKLHWEYKYHNYVIRTGEHLVFSWQQGGYKRYYHNISLISSKPSGIVPLGQPYIKNIGTIIAAEIKGKAVKGGFDYDIPITAYISLLHLTSNHFGHLYCLVNWGDGTNSRYNCDSRNGVEVIKASHKYTKTGRYKVKFSLAYGSISSGAFSKYISMVDMFYIKPVYNGTPPVYGGTYNFDYVISDEIPEEPYTCSFDFHISDPPSDTHIASFGPEPCSSSGRSPSVAIYAPGFSYTSPGVLLDIDMVVANANHTVMKKTIQTSILPPVKARVVGISVEPNKVIGHGEVQIQYAGDIISHFGGARPSCELSVDNEPILRTVGYGCIGNHSITRTFTNPRRSYTIKHNITFKIHAEENIGDGEIVSSEDSKTVVLTVQPYAYVTGVCYVQSRVGGPYNKKVNCTIDPSGQMLPGTYTFSASSAYVCPSLTRKVAPGENTIRFNCHR